MAIPESVLVYGPRTQHSMEMGEVLTFAGLPVTSVNLRLEDAYAPPYKTFGELIHTHGQGITTIVMSDGALCVRHGLIPPALEWVALGGRRLIVMEDVDPLHHAIANAVQDLAMRANVPKYVAVVRPRPVGEPNALAVPSTSAILAFARAGWASVNASF